MRTKYLANLLSYSAPVTKLGKEEESSYRTVPEVYFILTTQK